MKKTVITVIDVMGILVTGYMEKADMTMRDYRLRAREKSDKR